MRVQVEGMSNWTPEKPLNPGVYNAKCVAADPSTTQKGDPIINLQFEIIEGPVQQDPNQEVEGRRIFDMVMLQYSGDKPRGEKFVKDKLISTVKAMGLDSDDEEFDTDDMIGTEVELGLKIGTTQNGSKRNEVNFIRPVGGFPEE